MISLINLFLESRARSAEFGGISRCAPAYEQDWELIVAISSSANKFSEFTISTNRLSSVPAPRESSGNVDCFEVSPIPSADEAQRA